MSTPHPKTRALASYAVRRDPPADLPGPRAQIQVTVLASKSANRAEVDLTARGARSGDANSAEIAQISSQDPENVQKGRDLKAKAQIPETSETVRHRGASKPKKTTKTDEILTYSQSSESQYSTIVVAQSTSAQSGLGTGHESFSGSQDSQVVESHKHDLPSTHYSQESSRSGGEFFEDAHEYQPTNLVPSTLSGGDDDHESDDSDIALDHESRGSTSVDCESTLQNTTKRRTAKTAVTSRVVPTQAVSKRGGKKVIPTTRVTRSQTREKTEELRPTTSNESESDASTVRNSSGTTRRLRSRGLAESNVVQVQVPRTRKGKEKESTKGKEKETKHPRRTTKRADETQYEASGVTAQKARSEFEAEGVEAAVDGQYIGSDRRARTRSVGARGAANVARRSAACDSEQEHDSGEDTNDDEINHATESDSLNQDTDFDPYRGLQVFTRQAVINNLNESNETIYIAVSYKEGQVFRAKVGSSIDVLRRGSEHCKCGLRIIWSRRMANAQRIESIVHTAIKTEYDSRRSTKIPAIKHISNLGKVKCVCKTRHSEMFNTSEANFEWLRKLILDFQLLAYKHMEKQILKGRREQRQGYRNTPSLRLSGGSESLLGSGDGSD